MDFFGGKDVKEVAEREPWQAVPPVQQEESSHRATINHFVDCLLSGRDPQPDGREGARTVAACLAVVESSVTGKPVRPATF